MRNWQMGFATTPPVLTAASVLATIDSFRPRAEIAIFHEEPPWGELLGGGTAEQFLVRERVDLVAYLRNFGFDIWWTIDLTDGLSRSDEARPLQAAGRSLSEPAIQQLARSYATAVDTLLQPSHLGLAAETNLIRAVAPRALYDAVVATSNAMANDLAVAGSDAVLYFTVQVETAQGLLPPAPFVGIAPDLVDFPFAQALGLSSYPYFAFATPEQIPDDYYRRVVAGTSLPVFVAEGGWTSASVGAVVSTPELQRRYLPKQAALLDSVSAIAWLQLLHADPDLTQWPPPIPTNLPLFTSIGLVDSNFVPKPALAEWDALFARPLR
jgi:hypothetical protein